MTITTNSGGEGDRAGWIEWHGGENPVGDAEIEVRTRGGGAFTTLATHLRFAHSFGQRFPEWHPNSDIIAYRVVSPVAGEGSFGSRPQEVVVPTEGHDAAAAGLPMLVRMAQAMKDRAGWTEYGPVVPESLLVPMLSAALEAGRGLDLPSWASFEAEAWRDGIHAIIAGDV